ncbi:activated RNA polymerase ii transcriptional coactivator p15 [Anaeramoeba ignava]|uniref:Activated RNA polymerase ii transcriptional coactivator p15 n=1 Tax=Anaeramoeba ignava TaxID=1746090 RepID=A0A9Q0L9S3_ANAIG|nr:activated RNA polymerase ii transcriptional coactivator p15 [Anaeramoeba ignava]|eukprot:Anaeramoba_ignava/a218584_26.p1 GENE.a218584_26~~a218584_26.p1  ORF type:complete len:157 (-),score=54.78 a218584_26:260-730(-)
MNSLSQKIIEIKIKQILEKKPTTSKRKIRKKIEISFNLGKGKLKPFKRELYELIKKYKKEITNSKKLEKNKKRKESTENEEQEKKGVSNQEFLVDIGESFKVSFHTFGNKPHLNIRKYFIRDGQYFPSTGVFLSFEQWEELKEVEDGVKDAYEKMK